MFECHARGCFDSVQVSVTLLDEDRVAELCGECYEYLKREHVPMRFECYVMGGFDTAETVG